jgi:hypothetical protein
VPKTTYIRQCLDNPNVFCYICGDFVVKKQRQNITSFFKTVYFVYCGIKLGDQDKPWATHTVCSVEDLRNWTKRKKKALWFGIPMVWLQPINHVDDLFLYVYTKRLQYKK